MDLRRRDARNFIGSNALHHPEYRPANSGPLDTGISGLKAPDFDITLDCDGIVLPPNAAAR